MWLLEHLRDASAILDEAARVLRPGGTIAITETDYSTFRLSPASPDWEALRTAQYDYFQKNGNPLPGPQLGELLGNAGFIEIRHRQVGFTFSHEKNRDAFRRHADYVAEFLEPGLDLMAEPGYDREQLGRAVSHLRRAPDLREGSMTQAIYRAHAIRPSGNAHALDPVAP